MSGRQLRVWCVSMLALVALMATLFAIGASHAQTTLPASAPASQITGADDVSGLLGALRRAHDSGNWRLGVAVALVLVVWGLRHWVSDWIPFLKSDRGGATLALAAGILVAICNALLVGSVDGWTVIKDCLTGVTAAGLWAVPRKLARKG